MSLLAVPPSLTVLVVPSLDEEPWPTLGPLVCAWIEANLVYGPGDLLGQPAKLDAEKRALIYRMYQVFPQDDPRAGRRRFKRCALSLRKGSAKTELAAWIAAAELHPKALVRCAGFDRHGRPIGRGVVDPYIPMVAYSEEQTEELGYGALRQILEHSRIAKDFDIGLARIMRRDGNGKAEPRSSAPGSRDGARTTFQHFDETAHFRTPTLRRSHRTMLMNIPKRKLSDAWSLETTTAYVPGEGSVAEKTMEYARAIAEGNRADAELFFFHRQASEHHDLVRPEGLRAAVVEASGPTAEWSDIDSIVGQWKDPTADPNVLAQMWLNQPRRNADKAFDFLRWRQLAKPRIVPPRAKIALGFDGSRYRDATALVGTEISTGYQWLVGLWERPAIVPEGERWEVPETEVSAQLAGAFKEWDVWRLYADPPYWETTIDNWSGDYGEERVVKWLTRLTRKCADACLGYHNAILSGELSHDGKPEFDRHVGNAYRRAVSTRDEKGNPMWVIQKERPDSPNKMDAAMAGVLSWTARRDAVALGLGKPKESVYSKRGILRL